jgi:hypothetical protein
VKRSPELSYSELPKSISDSISEPLFLCGYYSPFRESIVCWIKSNNPRQQIEREFDLNNETEIVGHARLDGLPTIEEFTVGDECWKVSGEFSLLGGNCLCEVFNIYTSDGLTKVAEAGQKYFSPVRSSREELCSEATRRSEFPKIYASWPAAEKINYWVAHLYRLRRHTAEAGGEESNVFSRGLLDQMAETDPNIVGLFPGVVRALALMEGENEAELLELAGKKAGLVLQ